MEWLSKWYHKEKSKFTLYSPIHTTIESPGVIGDCPCNWCLANHHRSSVFLCTHSHVQHRPVVICDYYRGGRGLSHAVLLCVWSIGAYAIEVWYTNIHFFRQTDTIRGRETTAAEKHSPTTQLEPYLTTPRQTTTSPWPTLRTCVI